MSKKRNYKYTAMITTTKRCRVISADNPIAIRGPIGSHGAGNNNNMKGGPEARQRPGEEGREGREWDGEGRGGWRSEEERRWDGEGEEEVWRTEEEGEGRG